MEQGCYFGELDIEKHSFLSARFLYSQRQDRHYTALLEGVLLKIYRISSTMV
jgi:hypothetical protein